MRGVIWLMLAAAMLPYIGAILAKAGGKGFSNEEPRAWLHRQQGWRARANAAQQNLFEGLPFFFAAALLALHAQVDMAYLSMLMQGWLLARVAYLACYVAGRGMLRSLAWGAALCLNIAMLLSAV